MFIYLYIHVFGNQDKKWSTEFKWDESVTLLIWNHMSNHIIVHFTNMSWIWAWWELKQFSVYQLFFLPLPCIKQSFHAMISLTVLVKWQSQIWVSTWQLTQLFAWFWVRSSLFNVCKQWISVVLYYSHNVGQHTHELPTHSTLHPPYKELWY